MQRKIVEPMTVLYAAQELTIPEVSIYGEKYGAEIMDEVENYGLRIVGPWVFISYNLPKNGKERYTTEFCLAIGNGEIYIGGRFSIKSLGTFSCAFTDYSGKLRHLFTKGYQPLIREIVTAKLDFTGESREVYHKWVGPNSPENRIEIQFGVM
jgi:effector-binding domain-containing protein